MTRSQTDADGAQVRSSNLPRALISRFATPFASKQRSSVDHEIRLDEPFRQYFPGDAVKGAVVINATKPCRITHLVIRLHGYVKVVNNARQPGESVPYDENLLTTMRNRKGIEYYGNGFARLFEDECILCGDGRLFGNYQFRFELNLPPSGIPSSIDFEHGTIAYLLSSTLTRPTTISPTLTCHKKVKVTGNIDISRLKTPKSRTVSLDPVGKRAKARLLVTRKNTGNQSGKECAGSSTDDNSVSRTAVSSPQPSDGPPPSPIPSISSSASAESSTFSASNAIPRHIAGSETNGSVEYVGSTGQYEKSITATTQLLQGGCLPGDTLNLKVYVDHVKPVRAMQGLIVTVFRQGRIDTHPAIPLGPMNTGDRRQYEDYYPRSRTGLGGLSLSAAGSSRAFRQDLAQTMAPLFVDPQTLTATVKTSIQIPDHIFPTITSVPGDMISFRYYVEVVVDLRGRSAGQDRFMTHLNIVDGPQHAYRDPKVSKVEGVDGVSFSASPGFNYLITDQIRRTKGVVFTTTEIVIGTRDSSRARGKQRESGDASDAETWPDTVPNEGHDAWSTEDYAYAQNPPYAERGATSPVSQQGPLVRENVLIPPPETDDNLDEKAQIRRAEQRLLPSAPPGEEDVESAASPSAPFAYDEEDFVQRYGFGAPAPAYEGPSTFSSDDTSPTLKDTSQGTAAQGRQVGLAPNADDESIHLGNHDGTTSNGVSQEIDESALHKVSTTQEVQDVSQDMEYPNRKENEGKNGSLEAESTDSAAGLECKQSKEPPETSAEQNPTDIAIPTHSGTADSDSLSSPPQDHLESELTASAGMNSVSHRSAEQPKSATSTEPG